ncbi:mucin-2-like isoform X2 [Syngnathus typhle]|uniref:mucin-2-like isoform X2 n=1 Tax=Syngnathus typhle TaxID=161592 RepID=UPI002A6AA892|nr:mucin-2-like isoform X2 [Syngnathus typhle]
MIQIRIQVHFRPSVFLSTPRGLVCSATDFCLPGSFLTWRAIFSTDLSLSDRQNDAFFQLIYDFQNTATVSTTTQEPTSSLGSTPSANDSPTTQGATTAVPVAPPAVFVEAILLEPFVEELNNRSSEQYQQLETQVISVCDSILLQEFGTIFIRTIVNGFSPQQGNTKVELDLEFNNSVPTDQIPEAEVVVEKLVQAVNSTNNTFPLTFAPDSIAVITDALENTTTDGPSPTHGPTTTHVPTTEGPTITDGPTITHVPTINNPTTTHIFTTHGPMITQEQPPIDVPTTPHLPTTQGTTNTQGPTPIKGPTTRHVPTTKGPTITQEPTPTHVPTTTGPTITQEPTLTDVPTTKGPTVTQKPTPTHVPTTKGPTITQEPTPTDVPTTKGPTITQEPTPTHVPTTKGPTITQEPTPTDVPTTKGPTMTQEPTPVHVPTTKGPTITQEPTLTDVPTTKGPTVTQKPTPTHVPTTKGPTITQEPTPTDVPTTKGPTITQEPTPTHVPTTTGPTITQEPTLTDVPTTKGPTVTQKPTLTHVPTTKGPTITQEPTPTHVPTAKGPTITQEPTPTHVPTTKGPTINIGPTPTNVPTTTKGPTITQGPTAPNLTTPAVVPTSSPPVVVLSATLEELFVEEFNNVSSSQYIALERRVVNSCDAIYRARFGIFFIRIFVIRIFRAVVLTRMGNTQVEVGLVFKNTSSTPTDNEVVATLEETLGQPNNTFNIRLVTESIEVIDSPHKNSTTAKPNATAAPATTATKNPVTSTTSLTTQTLRFTSVGEVFTSDLLNQSSTAFVSRASLIKKTLEPFYNVTFSSFNDLTVTSFSNGSIVNSMDLRFESSLVPSNNAIANVLINAASNITVFNVDTSSIFVNGILFSSAASHKTSLITASGMVLVSWLLVGQQ